MSLYYTKNEYTGDTATCHYSWTFITERDKVDYTDDIDEFIQDINDIAEAEADFKAGRCISLKDWIEKQMNHYKDILDRLDD